MLSFGLLIGGSYSELHAAVSPAGFEGNWVHLAATFDGTSGAYTAMEYCWQVITAPVNSLSQVTDLPFWALMVAELDISKAKWTS